MLQPNRFLRVATGKTPFILKWLDLVENILITINFKQKKAPQKMRG